MNICIVGWYGTETLGDRAILDGIMRIFGAIDKKNNYFIGSLYPIVTERTIFEDMDLYNTHSEKNCISTFDVRNRSILSSKIDASDIVIMGGGPLMNIGEIYIIEHALCIAKKRKKVTALLGCGYVPSDSNEYHKCIRKIINNCDLIIMRSRICKENMEMLCGNKSPKKIYYSCDPAEISVIEYANQLSNITKNNNWILNIRDLDYVYPNSNLMESVKKIVANISDQIHSLILMPNHTFTIGGDDRYILNKVAFEISKSNVTVIQKPLTLVQAYSLIASANGCIGMRYHSIVFQTFLNGNNYILDYTDPSKGKIAAFLNELNGKEFYDNRYIDVRKSSEIILDDNGSSFEYNKDISRKGIAFYKSLIEKLVYKK